MNGKRFYRRRYAVERFHIDADVRLYVQVGFDVKVGVPDVEARARRIFGNRIIPNLVLLEREESSS